MTPPLWTRLASAAAAARARVYERVLLFRLTAPVTASSEARVLDEQAERDLALPYPAETLRYYRSLGWRLFSSFVDDVPASFAWARVAPDHVISEVGARVRSPRPAGWIVHCITPEAYRGRGLYPQLIRAVAAGLPAGETFIYCTGGNAASRRGIEKAGFRQTGEIRRVLGRLSCSDPGLAIEPAGKA